MRERGIGVEAGAWTQEDAYALLETSLSARVLGVLVEVTEADADVPLGEAIDGHPRPGRRRSARLHHGEGTATWPVLERAVAPGRNARQPRGHPGDTRRLGRDRQPRTCESGRRPPSRRLTLPVIYASDTADACDAPAPSGGAPLLDHAAALGSTLLDGQRASPEGEESNRSPVRHRASGCAEALRPPGSGPFGRRFLPAVQSHVWPRRDRSGDQILHPVGSQRQCTGAAPIALCRRIVVGAG